MSGFSIPAHSFSDIVNALLTHCSLTEPMWFRGQADASWKLDCSLSREGGIEKEMPLIKRFKQNALQIMRQHPTSEWEWLFTMQHYSLPTRLQDWSESPLTALYFAVHTHPEADGALWVLNPTALNRHGNLDSSEIPGFGDDEHLDSYLPSALAKQRQILSPLAAIAPRNTPRILSQQGVFVVFHINLAPLEVNDENIIWRCIIPKETKKDVLRAINLLGVHRLSLFPELDSVSEHARTLCHE